MTIEELDLLNVAAKAIATAQESIGRLSDGLPAGSPEHEAAENLRGCLNAASDHSNPCRASGLMCALYEALRASPGPEQTEAEYREERARWDNDPKPTEDEDERQMR